MTKNEAFKQFNEEYSSLRDSEKEIFSRIALKLLAETFIIRDKEGEKNDYINAKDMLSCLRAYFGFINYSVHSDVTKGIIYLRSENDSNRLKLNKLETICALVLRCIGYDESRKASVNAGIMTTLEQISSEIIKTGIYLDFDSKSGDFKEALKRLKRHKIIDFSGELTNGSTPITIYKTINLIIDADSINEILERIELYKGVDNNETNQETKAN